MQTIPTEIVDAAWERFSDLSQDGAKELIDRMAAEQPAIMAYLLANDEGLAEKEERGTLLCLGMVVWELMTADRAPDEPVAPEALEAAEDANVEFLERMGEESEIGYMEAVSQMVAAYNQMPLLSAILQALMEGHEEEPELAPENLGLMLVQLKTVIDCLDH
jgi:2-oxoglutarate dehydrogenase complex dehydrogenase (E1) component-like enzyme